MPISAKAELKSLEGDDDLFDDDDDDDDDILEDDDEDEEDHERTRTERDTHKTLTNGVNRKRYLESMSEHENETQNEEENELDEFLATKNHADECMSSDGEACEANAKHAKKKSGVLFYLDPGNIKKEKLEAKQETNTIESNSHLMSGVFFKQEQIEQIYQSSSLFIEPMQIKTDFTCSVDNQASPR